jgi:hypothetical protein
MTWDTQENIAGALRALVDNTKSRPEAARLRDVFDAVETALRSGVRREVVLAELHKHGFTMQMGGFKSTLQRIRKERAGASKTLGPKTAPAASAEPANASPLQKQPGATSPLVRSEISSTDLPKTPNSAGKSPIQKILDEPVRRQSYKSLMKKD